jgi:putative colanic acid biosynthesis UDP-glucose lipid carrier transferase
VSNLDDTTAPATRTVRQWPVAYREIPNFAALVDFIAILVAGLVAAEGYHELVLNTSSPMERSLAVSLFAAVVFVGVTRLQQLYRPTQLLLWNVQVSGAIWIWCATFFLLSGWLFMWKSSEVSRGAVMTFWVFGLIVLIAVRAFWRFFLERALERGSLRGRRIVLVGFNRSALDSSFAKRLVRYGYDLRGEFVIDAPSQKDIAADVIGAVRGSDIEEILVLMRSEDLPHIARVADQLRILPVPVTLLADGITADLVRLSWFDIGPAVAIEVQKPPRNRAERLLKRIFDIVLAAACLILCLPLMALVAIAIRLDSAGPVLFWQTRRGFNGKPFRIAKFRTMRTMDDGAVVPQASLHDARVTRVGGLLRRASIDEIPQLLNVLRGEMSLVGPRPHAVAHDDHFIETVEDYAYRHHVKPGITGWAQIHGYRGETRTQEAIERRVEYDRWYIANWSIWLDIAIIVRTLGEVMRGRNAY